MTTTAQHPTTFDEKVQTANGMCFYRVGRTVICVDEDGAMTDVYADVEAARLVLDIARS